MATVERPEPPYLQISAQIKDRILAGQYAPGDHVPSARQIMDEWDVANATAGKVLKHLRASGLIESEPGRGSVVRRMHLGPQDYARSVLNRSKIYPEGYYARISRAELVEAPESIAEALGVEAGEQVIYRKRVTYAPDHTPLSASTSWFRGELADVAPLLLSTERILQGTAAYIVQATGLERSPRERARVSAGSATATEAADLRVERDSPILRGRNWYWDVHGGVIEYGESAAAEGLEEEFEYTVEREQAP